MFSGLEKELIQEIIETTESGKAVVNFLCTSQKMNQICQPSICKVYAKICHILIEPLRTLESRIFNTFTEPKPYIMSIAQLYFLQKKDFFALGDRHFSIYNTYKGQNDFNLCDPNATVSFEPKTERGLSWFYCSVPIVLGEGTKIKDFLDKEYIQKVNIAGVSHNLTPNYFVVTALNNQQYQQIMKENLCCSSSPP